MQHNLLVRFYSYLRKFDTIWIAKSFLYDLNKYRDFSGVGRKKGETAKVVMDLHRIEKGLALPKVRRNFGRDVIARLEKKKCLIATDQYLAGFALGALTSYLVHCDDAELLRSVSQIIDEIDSTGFEAATGGIKRYVSVSKDCSELLNTRSSVRQYQAKLIDNEVLDYCITSANLAPSVCNRQSCEIMLVKGKEKIDDVLKLQNGNIGFRQDIYNLAVILSDIRCFNSPGERNQMFVDGGLFSMSFLLALHNEGIGSCCLNWSVEDRKDKAIHDLLSIPKYYRVIMLVSFGLPKDNGFVAASPRETS